jgi:hypothetical protein
LSLFAQGRKSRRVLLGQPDICSPGAIVGFAALLSGGAWTAVGCVTLVALAFVISWRNPGRLGAIRP